MNEIIVYKSIDKINKEEWRKLLDSSLFATFFQSPECFDFYKSQPFLNPFVFAVSENGILRGVMCGYIVADGGFVKQFFSRRAIILGGPLLDQKISDKAIMKLFQVTTKFLKNKSIYIEIRNFVSYKSIRPIIERTGFAYHPHLNFHLDSSNLEQAFAKLKSNKRRYIRLTEKEGVTFSLTDNESEIEDLYTILKKLYEEKVKTPLFPVSFFIALSKLKSGRIIVVKFNEKIIGGGVFVVLPNKAIYEWFICGEDRVYKNVHPSVYATWAGIKYAAENNIPVFDFMGAGKPDIDYGVRKFKAEFGGELVEHGRFVSINNAFLFKIGEIAVKIMKK